MLTKEQKVERKEMAASVNKGLSVRDVANQYGVPTSIVYGACGTYGVQNTRRGNLTVSTYEILAELINTNKTLDQIGEEHHVSHQWVTQILRKARQAGIRFPLRRRNRRK